jgi:hypothetical protein
MALYDDGSAAWMERVFQMRMKGVHAPLYQEPDHRKIAALRAQPIQDPYIKEVIKRYNEAPQYGPAHLGFKNDPNAAQTTLVTVNDDALMQKIAVANQQAKRGGGWDSYDDAEAALQNVPAHLRGTVQDRFQRLQGGQQGYQGQQHMQAPNNQPQAFQATPQVVRLAEGYACFRALNTQGFYAKFPLVKNAGQTNQQVASLEFAVRGVVKAYILQPNQTQVDMALLERSPQMLTELVMVEAAPMTGIGTILVPRQCISTNQQRPQQRPGVILDSPVRNQYNQQVLQSVVPPRQKLISEVPNYGPRAPQRILRG